MYNKAWGLLEKADLRAGRAREIRECPTTPLWREADHKARSAASEAVEAAPSVKAARKLADKARQGSDLRAYAKAVAARIATEAAIFDEAYGLAMPREWWSK